MSMIPEPSGSLFLRFGGDRSPAIKLDAIVTEWSAIEIGGEITIKIKLSDGEQPGECKIVLNASSRQSRIHPPADSRETTPT